MRQQYFWVIGGDQRQAALAAALAEDGHRVVAWCLDKAELPPSVERAESLEGVDRADCVVLPLPVRGEGDALSAPLCPQTQLLEDIFSCLRPQQYLCGGRVDSRAFSLAARYGLTIHDYFTREELAVANAVPTAEGAVQIALEEMGVTLHRCRALVLGYGRVGQLTAHRLAALGARVTVAARRYDALAWAEAYGHDTLRLGELSGYLCGFDLVVNTVPSRVLTRDLLDQLKTGCLVIDLASKPGGVDMQAAAELGARCVWALSLPGKVAPVSAGAIIRDTVYNMLREEI